MNDVLHQKRAGRILGFWKKSVELSPASEEDGWLSLVRRGETSSLCRVRTWFGAVGKVSIERMCISRKTFKLKGNKKFCTWTKKSLRVFRVSGFLCSMYICYEHSMCVSHIRIMGMLHEYLPKAMDDREAWRERESGISVLMARLDDDDDDVLKF